MHANAIESSKVIACANVTGDVGNISIGAYVFDLKKKMYMYLRSTDLLSDLSCTGSTLLALGVACDHRSL
jgi:hypothetical protein